MFKRYFIIFSAFLGSSLSHGSDSKLTEPPTDLNPAMKKAVLAIGEKLLKRSVHFDVGLAASSNSSPRTPETSAYKEYCIQVIVIVGEGEKGEVKETLKVTPAVKAWSKKDSPDAEHFFDYGESDFSPCLSPFGSLPSGADEKKEGAFAIRLRIWKNRNLMIYLVHQEQLEKALAAFPEGEESFEQALYKGVDVKETLKGTDYFSGEVRALKRAWKYLYDDLVTLATFLKEGTPPPPSKCS